MKSFAEKIRSLINPKNDSNLKPASAFDFVKTRKGIFKELVISRQSNSVIGVYCKTLGPGMFLTAVEAIEPTAKSEMIIFHRYDVSGQQLVKNKVLLDEIQMVCPFNRFYQKPVLKPSEML